MEIHINFIINFSFLFLLTLSFEFLKYLQEHCSKLVLGALSIASLI